MTAQRRRRRHDDRNANSSNSRLGIDLCTTPPPSQLLPPLRQPHAHQEEQQQQERQALRDAFRERMRANRKHFACASLLPATIALDALTTRNASREQLETNDCVAFVTQLAHALEDAAPLAARFVTSLANNIHALVHTKLHTEAAVATVTPRLNDSVGSPSHSPRCMRDDAADVSSDLEESQLSSDSSSDGAMGGGADSSDSDVSGAREPADASKGDASKKTQCDHPSVVASPRGDTFRTSRRCRAFPPSRVPSAEHIATVCAYTPFDHAKGPSDRSSLRLTRADSDRDGAKQWHVVQFPRAKPRMSREETDALLQWARRKLAALESDKVPDDAATVTRFHRTLALSELVCFELTRLVFDKCPTTARFLHGLFVELVDTALRTAATADRESQVNSQRHKNAHLELERLTTQLDAVRSSLANLKETLCERQRHLLRERERIIRHRKKLNVLLCAVRPQCTYSTSGERGL